MAQCSNCGNTLVFRYSFAAVKCCEQCGHVVSTDPLSKVDYKNMPVPEEYCMDLIHKHAMVGGNKGTITGRLRYFYEEGYLNKWPLCFDTYHTWICESLGRYFVLSASEAGMFGTGLGVEDAVYHGGIRYTVDSIHDAHGYSLQGEMPNFDAYFFEFKSIECSCEDDLLIIHQMKDGSQIFFTGRDITYKELISILR